MGERKRDRLDYCVSQRCAVASFYAISHTPSLQLNYVQIYIFTVLETILWANGLCGASFTLNTYEIYFELILQWNWLTIWRFHHNKYWVDVASNWLHGGAPSEYSQMRNARRMAIQPKMENCQSIENVSVGFFFISCFENFKKRNHHFDYGNCLQFPRAPFEPGVRARQTMKF